MKKRNQYAIIGSEGRMGQELQKILTEKKISFLGVERSGRNNLKNTTFDQVKMILDFSSPDIFENIIIKAAENNIPLVSGTTGLTLKQFDFMQKQSKKIPILWSANMSIGIAVLKKAIKSFSALKNFDYQIEEFHHRGKKDSPSGTAKALQEALKKTTKKNIPEVLSIRAGGIIGCHKIHAVSDEEHIIFEHSALQRRVFATGAVRAAEWLLQHKNGLYSIEDLIHDL